MLIDNAEGSMLSRFLREQLRGASIKYRGSAVGQSAAWLGAIPGRRTFPVDSAGGANDILISQAPENALPDIAISFQPDMVVGSTMSQPTWASIQETCEALHTATCLYMCDERSVTHLKPTPGYRFRRSDLLLASNKRYVTAAERVGAKAHYLPPLVDLSPAQVQSTRERILLIDPRPEYGVQVVEELAAHFRTIEFVLQESTPLSNSDKVNVDEILAKHPNVIYRSATSDPSKQFRDAMILLAPQLVDEQPASILQAFSNGIPVIANDLPSLRDAVGDVGFIATSPSEWIDVVTKLWQNPATYRDSQRLTKAFARRKELEPAQVADTFLTLVHETIKERRNRLINLRTARP